MGKCFHNWIECKEIKDGNVNYYRVCKWCGRVQKWLGGSYYECDIAPQPDWELVEQDADFWSR